MYGNCRDIKQAKQIDAEEVESTGKGLSKEWASKALEVKVGQCVKKIWDNGQLKRVIETEEVECTRKG